MAIEFPEEESNELELGQRVPVNLRPLCKKNEYGQFSLRFKKFLYIVNQNFRIEEKAPDTLSCYPTDDMPAPPPTPVEFLPKTETEEPEDLPEFEDPKPETEKDSVDKMVDAFRDSVEEHHIEAADFLSQILSEANRNGLRQASVGDLSGLGFETNGTVDSKKTGSGKAIVSSLLKAVLIHKLYSITPDLIKNDKMLLFLSDIIVLEEDGSRNVFIDNLTAEQQNDLLFFFNALANIYKNKAEVIQNLHKQLSSTIMAQYQESKKEYKDILFRAFFIHKIYQSISLKDEKKDPTMCRILKEIIGYK